MLRFFSVSVVLIAFLVSACETEQPPPGEEQPMPDEQEMPADQEGMGADVDVSDEDLESFVRVNVIAQRDQIDPQTDMEGFENLLEEEGLSIDEYEEINMDIQADPGLQQEFQRLYEEIQMEMQQEM
ncbi:hypothetical protein [Natronogracilivirga saccharolytica]|uniref:DUF4168 domain-containing protein n=1 Tax=Natronogracilivirga saccharolytica TaxID=2812953 RepID=A0A8J7UWH0_9BACT|nr:hypothetical protein [Natronogracilivirga saccharolytica]MBP3193666.1 hypothetical protein [Natronogracilivirga saccharolytica]